MPHKGIERRLAFRLLDQWHDLKEGERYPQLFEVMAQKDSEDFRHCFVFKVKEDLEQSEFLYIGEELAGSTGCPQIGDALGTLADESLVALALRHLDKVMETGVPVSKGGEAELDGQGILYRSTLMPISSDGVFMDALWGGVNFRFRASDGESG
ncbi:hypothetical protein [Kiloniella sp. b19]|uniref:hypothetical protein n=1 Tax=Kiloniella sp. GXU_MW_B19 TaxID=3141326 RepID=UPI0031DF3E59